MAQAHHTLAVFRGESGAEQKRAKNSALMRQGPFKGTPKPIFMLHGRFRCWERSAPRGCRAEGRIMTAKSRFRGSFTALVTPFKNGSVDEKAFRDLVEWQIAEGTNGLVPVGTTGESPTLSHDEHKQVVEWCVEQARGRVPVVAGAGSTSTREAIDLAQHAEKAGADAVLVVTP